MKHLFLTCAFAALIASSQSFAADAPAAPAAAPTVNTTLDVVPAGDYTLDKAHASLNFRVLHMGISHYTARFTRFDATLHFDPSHPSESSVTATIDPSSIQTNYPNPTPNFDEELQNDKWLDVAKFPQMTFKSTKVEVTNPGEARVTGDLGLHGMTHPVTLEVSYNGGFGKTPMGGGSRIGFSAHGWLKRSDFGVATGIPAAGTKMGVSDEVEVIIEAEFTKPAAAPAK